MRAIRGTTDVENRPVSARVAATVRLVRWNELFDDLEGQLERGLELEDADVRAEEERLRLGRLTLRDRLVALTGERVALTLVDGSPLDARATSFGRDWMAAELGERREPAIVPLGAIAQLALPRASVASSLRPRQPEPSALSERLGFAFVLRDLCRRRVPLAVVLGGGTVTGTIDRVGRDHLDLAVHELGDPRRERLVAGTRVLAFDHVLVVRF